MTGRSVRAPLGNVGGEELDRVYYYTIFPSMLLSCIPITSWCTTAIRSPSTAPK